MFEKDEDYRKARKESKDRITKVIKVWSAREETLHDEGFQQGAEFGYNKANEWHYVKDGDLPKDTTVLYLVRVYSWDFGFSHLYKKNGTYIPTVCEWNGEYFKALDSMAYSNARNIKSCFAWKEIVLPELKESE